MEELSAKYRENRTQRLRVKRKYSISLDKGRSRYLNIHKYADGDKNYMHCTGVGKVLLAYKSPEELDMFLDQPLKPLTFNSNNRPDDFKKEMSKIH